VRQDASMAWVLHRCGRGCEKRRCNSYYRMVTLLVIALMILRSSKAVCASTQILAEWDFDLPSRMSVRGPREKLFVSPKPDIDYIRFPAPNSS